MKSERRNRHITRERRRPAGTGVGFGLLDAGRRVEGASAMLSLRLVVDVFDALLVGVLAPLLLLASPPVMLLSASAGGPVHVPFTNDKGAMH